MKYRVVFDGVDYPLRDLSRVTVLQQYSILGAMGKYISIGKNLLLFYEIPGATLPVACRRYIMQEGGGLRLFAGMEQPEVYLLLEGSLHYSAKGLGWTFMQSAQFTIRYLPGKEAFSHLKKGEYTILSIGISLNFLGKLARIYPELQELREKIRKKEPYRFRLNGVASPYMMEAVQHILDCKLAGDTRRYLLDTMINSFLLQALPILIQVNRRSIASEPTSARNKLSKVADLILNSPEKKHSIVDLSRMVFMSGSSLAKGFKRYYGMTIHKFVIHHRMKKAQMLIINTSISIAEVALTVGYKDTATFTHTFNKLFGFPPSALRQQ